MTPELRFQLWTSGWRGAIVIFIAIALPLGLWKGDVAYHSLKVWRASHLIAEADRAEDKGDLTEAVAKLRQAAALMQRHPIVLRGIIRYQTLTHEVLVLDTYEDLIKSGEATTADKIAYCQEAFRLSRPDKVLPLVDELKLIKEINGSAAVLALIAEQLASQKKWPESLTVARNACDSPGTDLELAMVKVVLARLLLEKPVVDGTNPTGIDEAISLLSVAAMRPDSAGLEALGIFAALAQNAQMAKSFLHKDTKALVSAGDRHPQAAAALKVSLWNLNLAAEPDLQLETVNAFFERFKAESDQGLQLEAMRWLNQKGMYRMVLTVAEPAKLRSKDWFLIFLDATAASGHWEIVIRELASDPKNIPLPEALRRLFAFRGEMELGRHPDATEAWRGIRLAARGESASTLLYMAGYAEQIGFRDEAARIYKQLLELEREILPSENKLTPAGRLACFTGVLRTGAANMPLKELCLFTEKFAREFPELDDVQSDNAYLQLLSGGDVEPAATVANRLCQKRPDLLAYRTTLALAYLRQQKIASALAVYEGVLIEWKPAQDRFKAVYAAVLNAAGRYAEADAMVARISLQELKPEERMMVGQK